VAVVKFGSEMCMPCKAFDYNIAPWIIRMQGVQLAKIDAEQNIALRDRYNARPYPAILYFKD